jgi:hypothetical protein
MQFWCPGLPGGAMLFELETEPPRRAAFLASLRRPKFKPIHKPMQANVTAWLKLARLGLAFGFAPNSIEEKMVRELGFNKKCCEILCSLQFLQAFISAVSTKKSLIFRSVEPEPAHH